MSFIPLSFFPFIKLLQDNSYHINVTPTSLARTRPFTFATAPTRRHNRCRLTTDARPRYDCRHLDPAAYQPCRRCTPPPTLALLPPCSTWAPIPLVLIVVACTLISYKYIIILCNHNESVLTVPWPRIDYDMTMG